MNRRTGGIVLGAVGTVLLGLTLLAASPAGAAPQDLSDCLNPGAMVDCATTVGGTAADAAGVGGIQTALGGPEAWLKSLVESAGQGVELAFGMVQSYLSSSAEPELVAPWFTDGPYASAIRVSAMLVTLAAFAEIIRATVKQELGGLAGRIMIGLPVLAIAIGIAPTVLQTVVAFVDAVSRGIMSASNTDLRAFSDSILERTGSGATGVAGALIVLLIQLLLIVSLLITALALLLRQVAAYLLVVMIPISAMGVVFEPVRKFATRTVEVLFAVIFSKIVIVLALAVGAAALSSAVSAPAGPPPAASPPAAASTTTAPAQQEQGIALIMTGLAGIVTYGAAAFAPIGLLMLIPSAEAAAMSMRGVRQAGSEARQGMGAATGVDRAKGLASQGVMMGVSAGVSTAVAGSMGGGGAGGSGAGAVGGGSSPAAASLPTGQDPGAASSTQPAVPGDDAPTSPGTPASRDGGAPGPAPSEGPVGGGGGRSTGPGSAPGSTRGGSPPPYSPPADSAGSSGSSTSPPPPADSPGSSRGRTAPSPPPPPADSPGSSRGRTAPSPPPPPADSPGVSRGPTPRPSPAPPSPPPPSDPSDRATGDPR
jgi:hypothetical protein